MGVYNQINKSSLPVTEKKETAEVVQKLNRKLQKMEMEMELAKYEFSSASEQLRKAGGEAGFG